jgi:hypothetical protein
MKMTPQTLTAEVQKQAGDNLRSAILYGSAVIHDETKHFSNSNVLFIVKDLTLSVLKEMSPIVQRWVAEKNPAPLFFTKQHIRESQDVFPIEYLDIKAANAILFGEDVFSHISINPEKIRHQLEYELRTKLIQLRQAYFQTNGKPKLLQELLGKSLSSFSTLFRATLRLTGVSVPLKKAELWIALQQHVPIDTKALESIRLVREGSKEALSLNPDDLFSRFQKSIEAVIEFVDKRK